MNKTKFGSLLLLLQGILLILFVVFVDYGEEFKEDDESPKFEQNLPVFQDLHIMVFLGFGMVMTFLKRYSRGMLVHAFLIGGLVIQWATLLQGFFSMKETKVKLTLDRMINADYAVLVVLITLGALVGKVNSLQLLIIAMIETIVFTINEMICLKVLQAADYGRSMVVHLFGAVFGMVVSMMIFSKKICTSQALSMSYKSEMYAMIGTLFMWIFFPSLNSAFVMGAAKRRAIANTYYALAASCITTFSVTVLQSKGNRFNILHLQNATLTGGIAIGAVAALMVRPWGAIIIGVIGAVVSVLGYKFLLPKLRRSLNIHDVRGVSATHGLPAIVSGLASIVAACLATEESYKSSLYKLYPARSPLSNSTKYVDLFKFNPDIKSGDDRSNLIQGAYQLGALLISFIIAIIGGVITGFAVRVKFFEPLTVHDAFDDHADFQEATCIDVCSDDEYDDEEHQKHHDSINGNKRLLSTHHSSGDIAANDVVMTSYNTGGHHTPSSARSIRDGSVESIRGVTLAGSVNKMSSSNPMIVENGIEMTTRKQAEDNSFQSPSVVDSGQDKNTSDHVPLITDDNNA